MSNEQDKQHLQELASYRFTVENLETRIAELEAELEAIGAGGVEPLRKCNKLHQIAEPATVQAAPSEVMGALRALHDSVELAIQHGALSERALEIIIMQPATDVLMRAAAPQAVHGVGALYALQEAEAALELAIHRILKRDPSHAVHVTSEAKALVAVRAALDTAAPAHPAEGVPVQVLTVDALAEKLRSIGVHGGNAEKLMPFLSEYLAATHPTQQGLDDRDVFERAYAEHAIAYAGLDAHVDDVVQRVKDGRDGNSYKHLHDSGAWVGWNLVLAAQAKQVGAA